MTISDHAYDQQQRHDDGADTHEQLQEHDAPTIQSPTIEDPALNAGSSSITDVHDLDSYHPEPGADEHQTSWRRRALRVGAPFLAVLSLGGVFFAGRSSTGKEEVNPTPSTLDLPAPGNVATDRFNLVIAPMPAGIKETDIDIRATPEQITQAEALAKKYSNISELMTKRSVPILEAIGTKGAQLNVAIGTCVRSDVTFFDKSHPEKKARNISLLYPNPIYYSDNAADRLDIYTYVPDSGGIYNFGLKYAGDKVEYIADAPEKTSVIKSPGNHVSQVYSTGTTVKKATGLEPISSWKGTGAVVTLDNQAMGPSNTFIVGGVSYVEDLPKDEASTMQACQQVLKAANTPGIT